MCASSAPGMPELQPYCPDCSVVIGQAHDERCDIARCLATGLQRLGHPQTCRCSRDVWTGRWPGEVDCVTFGWMIGPGLPDLNRLYTEAIWDADRRGWVKRAA